MGKWLVWLKTVGDLIHFLCLSLRPRGSLAAENLFLRKQLAFYQERKIKPRRTDNPTRLTLVALGPLQCPHDHGNPRTRANFVRFSRECRKSQTRWRWPQSSANHSLPANSLLNRENTGNSAVLGPDPGQ